MADELTLKPIARIRNDYTEKFGVPRQSGLVEEVTSLIVFEPEYRVESALRGLESFTHLWLLWGFSKAVRDDWSPTVRPPRLGGNKRMGVFATRSPFRPNNIGLSSVELVDIRKTQNMGTVIEVRGADMMDGTPIYDIKPYLPYTDCHPEATGGYTDTLGTLELQVNFPPELLNKVPDDKQDPLIAVLRHDPRPTYQSDPERIYGMTFGTLNVKFKVSDGVLTVVDI
jgi:tRNA-Thr(GGU) m(6)t(6)A37 methyltransferase TsaA